MPDENGLACGGDMLTLAAVITDVLCDLKYNPNYCYGDDLVVKYSEAQRILRPALFELVFAATARDDVGLSVVDAEDVEDAWTTINLDLMAS
jgi:hypothetical protein